MFWPHHVQANKMLPVQRQYSATFLACKFENFIIGNGLIRPAGFMSRQNVMPQSAQFQYDGERKVFVGI